MRKLVLACLVIGVTCSVLFWLSTSAADDPDLPWHVHLPVVLRLPTSTVEGSSTPAPAETVTITVTATEMPLETPPPADASGTPTPAETVTFTTTSTETPGTTSTATETPIAMPMSTETPSPTAATAPPTTVTTTPSPTLTPGARFFVSQVSIPTYPYTPFLRTAVDPAVRNYPLLTLNRHAYDSSYPRPRPVTYTLLVLENRYLRLTLLPQLGGRIYECIFKPTGHDLLYRNPVLKPTHWGPLAPAHPADANWWLAAGGIEWGFPVEEHGYEWAVPWSYAGAGLPDGSVVVTLTAPSAGRPAYPAVTISLAPEQAGFGVQPQITNPGTSAFRFKWWANAMLAPGGANRAGADLHFIFPVNEMTVHSRADETLPLPGQALPWPVYKGRDLSRLGNWYGWLGVFERPAAAGDFMGAYDTAAGEGMVRIFPAAAARGAKGFGMGWGSGAIAPSEWTDDGSSYVELHGGLAPTFDDWYDLPAGASLTWQETWYPVAGIGPIAAANDAGALSLTHSNNSLQVGLYPARAATGAQIQVTAAGSSVTIAGVDLSPEQPFLRWLDFTGPLTPGTVVMVLATDATGREITRYQAAIPP